MIVSTAGIQATIAGIHPVPDRIHATFGRVIVSMTRIRVTIGVMHAIAGRAHSFVERNAVEIAALGPRRRSPGP
jgi:hypothetical protein